MRLLHRRTLKTAQGPLMTIVQQTPRQGCRATNRILDLRKLAAGMRAINSATFTNIPSTLPGFISGTGSRNTLLPLVRKPGLNLGPDLLLDGVQLILHHLKSLTFQRWQYETTTSSVAERIRDIMVRIRIRGPLPLTNGSCYFVSDIQDGNKKNSFPEYF